MQAHLQFGQFAEFAKSEVVLKFEVILCVVVVAIFYAYVAYAAVVGFDCATKWGVPVLGIAEHAAVVDMHHIGA